MTTYPSSKIRHPDAATRKCMCCKRAFASEHKFNRLCGNCKSNTQHATTPTVAPENLFKGNRRDRS